MTPEEAAALEVELADAKRKLAAREGKPGYTANVELLKGVIAALEAQLDV